MNTSVLILIGVLLVSLWLYQRRRARRRRFNAAALITPLAQMEAEFEQFQLESRRENREYRKLLRELSQNSSPESPQAKSPKPKQPKTPKPLSSQPTQNRQPAKEQRSDSAPTSHTAHQIPQNQASRATATVAPNASKITNPSNSRLTTVQLPSQPPSTPMPADWPTIRTRPTFLSKCVKVVYSSASCLLRPVRLIARAISLWFFHRAPRPPQADHAPQDARAKRAA